MGSLTKQSGSHAVFNILHLLFLIIFWLIHLSLRVWQCKSLSIETCSCLNWNWAHIKKLAMWQVRERTGLVELPKSRPDAKDLEVSDLAPRTSFEPWALQGIHLPVMLDPTPLWGRRREAGREPHSSLSCRLSDFTFSHPHLCALCFETHLSDLVELHKVLDSVPYLLNLRQKVLISVCGNKTYIYKKILRLNNE